MITLDPIYARRLTRLAVLLENYPEEARRTVSPHNGKPLSRFKMETWVCDTAACALGTAACHPAFVAEGLRIHPGVFYDVVAFEDRLRVSETPHRGRLLVGYRAAVGFFGITYDEAIDLFDPNSYVERTIAPEVVAARVRGLLKLYNVDALDLGKPIREIDVLPKEAPVPGQLPAMPLFA